MGTGDRTEAEQALKIADEDLDYLEALLSFAESGCPPEQAGRIAVPVRGEGTYGDAGPRRKRQAGVRDGRRVGSCLIGWGVVPITQACCVLPPA